MVPDLPLLCALHPCLHRLLQISKQAAFYASAGASAAGLLLTVLLLPDTTGLDLHEIDR